MARTIEVKSRVMGRSDEDLHTVLLEILEERITVAELIRRTVEEQISQMLTTKRLDAEAIRQALDRQYLTGEEVTAQAQRGRVRMPSRPPKDGLPQIDVAWEVAKAQRAVEQGTVLLYTGGRQLTRLDEELSFDDQINVVFLRLTPLVGG